MEAVKTHIDTKWKTLEFGLFVDRCSDKMNPKAEKDSVRCLELEHFEQGTGKILGHTESQNQSSIKNKFNKGDVLFGKLRPYLKKYYYADFDGVCSSEVWVLRGKEGVCSSHYLFYLVQQHRFIELCNKTSGSKMPRADWKLVIEAPFLLPPLPEQQKIAQILTTWDKAIEKQLALIDEKRHLKKGLMQQLLTGKKRFPGFAKEWEEKPFGDVFKFISTISYSRENLTYGARGIKYIHYGDIHSTYRNIILNMRNEEQVPILLENVSFPNKIEYLEEGDLVIADASEDYDGVAACVELFNVGDDKVIGGLHTFVARDNSGLTIAGCRGYLLKHVDVLREMRRIATGSKVYGISKTNLNKVVLKLPTIEEQQKIASVLSVAVQEIQKLQQELEELKEQKRGLMQKLLTGEVRVKTKLTR